MELVDICCDEIREERRVELGERVSGVRGKERDRESLKTGLKLFGLKFWMAESLTTWYENITNKRRKIVV